MKFAVSRIRFLRVLCLLLCCACGALREREALAEEWPRWRGPRGDGTWRVADLPEKWPAAGLPPTWKKPIGGGYGGIAVENQRVYLQDRQKQPSEVERVLCLDAPTGETLWVHTDPVEYGKLDYGNGPRGTPTVAGGRVYTLGAVGRLNCLDAATGAVVWTRDLVRDVQAQIPMWGLAASPILYGELVIVHPGAAEKGCLLALRRDDGREVWRAGDDPAGYATPILIRQGETEQLVAWTPEHILGVAPRTGAIQWSVPFKVTYGVSIATPIYHEQKVFVTGYWEGSKAIRLDDTLQQARLAWEDKRHLRGVMTQPMYRQGHVYSLDKQYGLTCFELATGKKLWDDKHAMTPRGQNPQANLIWLGDSDRVLILNAEGDLILARLDPQGYHEAARTKIIGPTWAHPAPAGDRLYARDDQEIVCVPLR